MDNLSVKMSRVCACLSHNQGEGTQLSPPVPGSVTQWETFATFMIPPSPPPPPTLLDSFEISESQPNQIFCHWLQCCQLPAEIASQCGTKFQHLQSFETEYLASCQHSARGHATNSLTPSCHTVSTYLQIFGHNRKSATCPCCIHLMHILFTCRFFPPFKTANFAGISEGKP
jgi:hypothetical protein